MVVVRNLMLLTFSFWCCLDCRKDWFKLITKRITIDGKELFPADSPSYHSKKYCGTDNLKKNLERFANFLNQRASLQIPLFLKWENVFLEISTKSQITLNKKQNIFPNPSFSSKTIKEEGR